MEILFSKIGFGDIPKVAQYLIAASIFAIPLVLMCYVICCMKDEVIEPPKRSQTQPSSEASSKKQAGTTSKREKIE